MHFSFILQSDTGCAASYSLLVSTSGNSALVCFQLKTLPSQNLSILFQRFNVPLTPSWASLVPQMVKNLPAMWQTWFNPWLGRSPEERNGVHSSILAWRIPWIEELPGGLQSMGSQKVRDNWAMNTFTLFHFPSLLPPTKMTRYFSYSSSENQSNTPPKCMGTGKYWGANEFLVNTNIPW